MPGFDKSGPMGGGPMTGRQRGYCNPHYAGYGSSAGYGFGRGFKRGYGPCRGFRREHGRMVAQYSSPFYGAASPDELDYLKQQATSVKNTLDAINSRIAELEKSE